MTQWSPQQATAIDRVGRWIQTRNQPVFKLGGWAGTGKTTLAKHLASTVTGRVYFAAYTGKAAHVLMKSGCPNVSTIHKLIYKPKDRSQKHLRDLEAELKELQTHNPLPEELIDRVQRAIEIEKVNLTRPAFALNDDSPLIGASLLVVDEYSMIDEQMGEDLLSYGVPILALGDPGQLPPVSGKPFFAGPPDMMLTEIHRQAADNPIIWMSKEIREGRQLPPGSYGQSRVVQYGGIDRGELQRIVLESDQLLVGRNATRISSNVRARELLGRTSVLPQEGDKLVCLRNNHDAGLLNGQIWRAVQDAAMGDAYVDLVLTGDDDQKVWCEAHPEYFHGKQPDYWAIKDAESFDYGFALTVHKSQGSQWPHVLLLDEWYRPDRKEWLYTAVTRASERIDIVKM